MNKLLVVSLMVFVIVCQDNIEINKSEFFAKELLCQESNLCKVDNCDMIKVNVTDTIQGKGTRFQPPDNTGGWECVQPRKVFVDVFCAYGVWKKNITKEETRAKAPEVCNARFDDVLTFQSVEKIQVDYQSVKQNCKVVDSGEEEIKNVDCNGVTIYANLRVSQNCGNKVTNLIRTKYSLNFNFDIQASKQKGVKAQIDIDYVGNSLNSVESNVIESDFHDMHVKRDDILFKDLMSKAETKITRKVMVQISDHIGSEPPFVPTLPIMME